jgi:hypothetical protein
MVAAEIDSVPELENAARLLGARWTLALPTAIASLIIGGIVFFIIGAVLVSVIAAVIVGNSGAALSNSGAALGVLGTGALTVAGALLAICGLAWFAHVVVLAAAHDAWQGRAPDFGAAALLTLRRLPSLLGAFVLAGVAFAIPIALSFVLVGVPLLFVVAYLLMYVRPAIMFDAMDPIAAFATSLRMTTTHAKPSAIAFGGMILAFIIGRVVDAMTVHLPVIGLLSAFFVGGLTAAYIALVEVRFYMLLREPQLMLGKRAST